VDGPRGKNREDHAGGRVTSTLTGDVLLRDVEEADLPVFFQHQLDPEATRMAGIPTRDR
jgi:hypothetical protein